jgi:GNAT superfamily N-acetyltransferase
MKYACWIIPIREGKTADARAYCDALEAQRRAEYEASEAELGIDREIFFLWHGPDRDYVVLYMEGQDMTTSLQGWVASEGAFELWGKSQWAVFTDPKDWPDPLWAGPGTGPVLEVLSAYDHRGLTLPAAAGMSIDPAGAIPELAGPGDVPALAAMCAAAFRDDAMIRWPMPSAPPEMLAELFAVILAPYAEFGVLWKIGGCDGGAAWLPPEVAVRFAEIEQSTRAAITPLTGDGGLRYATFWDWLDAHLPGEPCWFLDLVGVAPAAQRRGLGRALVRHGLERARADGCPAFLETGTPRNVPFYQSLGFEVVAEQQAPDGGPMIWFMQTPRAPSSAAIPAP